MYYNHQNVKLARNLRKEMTPWERKLWYCFLRNYSPKIQRQKTIDQYIVDFYCARAKLIIELDGGGHYSSEAEEKDRKRTNSLESLGYSVIRFCNLEVDKYFYEVCTSIDRKVKSIIEQNP